MSASSRSIHGTARLVGIGAVILCGATSPAAAQYVDVASVPVRWESPRTQDVPQDVRIMRTIVSTALSQVEAPALPKELAGDTAASERAAVVASRERALVASGGSHFFRRGDVSGFYMEGYGYLFTVSWPVSSMVAFNAQAFALARGERPLGEEARSGPSAAVGGRVPPAPVRRPPGRDRGVWEHPASCRRRRVDHLHRRLRRGDAETVTMTVKGGRPARLQRRSEPSRDPDLRRANGRVRADAHAARDHEPDHRHVAPTRVTPKALST